MQFGTPAFDDLIGEFVDCRLDAAAGYRARDGAVGGDDHDGAGRTRGRLDGADDGGDARCPAGSPNRQQLVEYVPHGRQVYAAVAAGLCECSAPGSGGVEFDGATWQ